MERKILDDMPKYPESKCFGQLNELIGKLKSSVSAYDFKSKDREYYIGVLREMEWGVGKVTPKWPAEVEKMMDNLRQSMQDLELSFQPKKFVLCGTSDKGKTPETLFRNVIGYQQMFALIGHYQKDRELLESFIEKMSISYEREISKVSNQPPPQIIVQQPKELPKPPE
mgnify:FL=1|jgi:hypothetical protein